MNIQKYFYFMVVTSLLSSCGLEKNANRDDSPLIGKSRVTIEQGLLSPELLQTLGQVGGVSVSPDRRKVLYGVTYTDIEQNKRNRELFVVDLDGSHKKQLTHTSGSESAARWIEQGGKIAFLFENQLWEMDADGNHRTQISHIEKGINAFKYAPDGKKILFISDVKIVDKSSEIYPDLPQSEGRIVDDLMYKHWDEWVETVPHPFVATYDGKELTHIVDLLDGEPFESPMKPMGGIEQLDWSPDSKTVAYTCRKKTGMQYTLSTNSDIYLYNIETGATENLTEGMMGYDTNPKFSPNGQQIAWLSMERDGYESDKKRLFVMHLDSREKRDLTVAFDFNVDAFCWNDASDGFYFVACMQGTTQLFAWEENKEQNKPVIRMLTEGQHDYASVMLGSDGLLLGLRHSMSAPNEVFTVSLSNRQEKNISAENNDLLEKVSMGKVEARWIKTIDGKDMLTWVIYPPHFDPQQQYPAILYCQGGPQNTVSQFWSVRWNLQLIASRGYIVVAPNRRGLPGFGQAWNEQISGDYTGLNMQDYLSAIDAISKEPYVDETRLGCTGASYGGFSVYWLAGNHHKRFKAFLAHAGIFNQEAQYLETEEMWFANWDFGGAFWEKNNATAQRTYATSPHRYVQQWDTPIMITHGEKDYRILASQGMMAFNAAKLRGIPARMIVYPNENHWITSPQNGVLFYREFFRWFDKWLKD
ncbi:MAG: S9 family peptidase [Dysgonamonadaceae bacterium]|jgi:dipeptidyl aminopeptidase/acylaminoacyl peptidase|nr:S9 family peptidase [Dysgonamonadaceae bacterium]